MTEARAMVCLSEGEGGWSTPRKVRLGCVVHPPLNPSPAIFATLTWREIWYLNQDCCVWHSCPKHNLWRAVVDGVINNDEKVASSKKLTQVKTRVQKPHPIYDQNSWKTISFGATHTYIAHVREYSPPPGVCFLLANQPCCNYVW